MLAKRQNVMDNDKSENVAASRQSNNLLKKMKTKKKYKMATEVQRKYDYRHIFKNPNFTNICFKSKELKFLLSATSANLCSVQSL